MTDEEKIAAIAALEPNAAPVEIDGKRYRLKVCTCCKPGDKHRVRYFVVDENDHPVRMGRDPADIVGTPRPRHREAAPRREPTPRTRPRTKQTLLPGMGGQEDMGI